MEDLINVGATPSAPQIGEEYEVIDDGNLVYGVGEYGECVGIIENCAVIRMSYGLGCFLYKNLRPIQSERNKLKEKALSAIGRRLDESSYPQDWKQFETAVDALIDEGLLS